MGAAVVVADGVGGLRRLADHSFSVTGDRRGRRSAILGRLSVYTCWMNPVQEIIQVIYWRMQSSSVVSDRSDVTLSFFYHVLLISSALGE